jgi:hypothetical protein
MSIVKLVLYLEAVGKPFMVRTAQASSAGVATGYGGWMCCPYKTMVFVSPCDKMMGR